MLFCALKKGEVIDMDILIPVLVIGGMGLVFGALLAVAAKIFHVDKDERIPLIVESLPGANCGGCGFAGCAAYAEAICKGEASVNDCPVGGNEAATKIAGIMGVEAKLEERMVAFVACTGTPAVAKERYFNNEAIDCHTANRLAGGMKVCKFGCLGCGSCVEKCQFGGIEIVGGIAKVNKELCTNCGACIAECPRGVIVRIPYSSRAAVFCNSKAPGKEVRVACDAGCLGCGICAKNCPKEAIIIEDNVARIDNSKCVGCGLCVEKCPKKCIELINENPKIQVAVAVKKIQM